MNPLAALLEKPWLADSPAPGGADEPAPGPARSVGVGLFLVVVTVIFALLTMAYMMRMGHGVPDPAQGSDWRAMGEPPLLWINTALLALSSIAFAVAAQSAQAGDTAGLRRGLLLGGLLGFAFLAGQLLLWRRLSDWGFALRYGGGVCRIGDPIVTFPFPPTILGNPALAFFYLISGLHGAHIAGGLAAWGLAARQVFARAPLGPVGVESVRLCALYWHFLLLVWAAMMALFVAT